MIFQEIQSGTAVFIDANTFIYHFISDRNYGEACTALLERIESRDLEGWTSTHILAETAHRLMTLEACSRFNWPYQGIAARLGKHPQHFSQLQTFRQAIQQIVDLEINITHVLQSSITQATDFSCQHGLLTNDALLVAVMHEQNLTQLASLDSDFDRVPWITRYSPV